MLARTNLKIVVLSYVCIIASSVQRSVSETLDENLGENCYNHLSVKIIREVAHVHWNLTEICKKGDCWFSTCVLRDWSFLVEVLNKRWVKKGNHVALSLPLYPSYLLVIILLFFYSTMKIEQHKEVELQKKGPTLKLFYITAPTKSCSYNTTCHTIQMVYCLQPFHNVYKIVKKLSLLNTWDIMPQKIHHESVPW